MKQTAVQWLIEQMYKECINVFTDEEIEQAKEMEKEQIIDAYIDGHGHWGIGKNAEQYYNETFKAE